MSFKNRELERAHLELTQLPSYTGSCLRTSAPSLLLAPRRLASTTSVARAPSTTSMSPSENIALLNEQRLKRPNSPHLAIYQPQVSPVSASVTVPVTRSGENWSYSHLISISRISFVAMLILLQLTWYLSSLTRITGVGLSGGLYLFSLAYLLHPSVLSSFDSAHIVQFAQDLPGWVKGSLKMPLAASFFFHSFNGVRHLAWDIGYGEL